MKERLLIGLMSGTSLDGLDIAYVLFSGQEGAVKFSLLKADTLPLPEPIKELLLNIENQSARTVFSLHHQLGLFYAEAVNAFIEQNEIDRSTIDAIASHGQTIFHQPDQGYTVQLGCGSTLAYHTGLPVINDFRSLDVVAGGQGAPLVPIGDHYLFRHLADAFVNIGGFSNISFNRENATLAFDIGPGNLPLNEYARKLGLDFDKDGAIAAHHPSNPDLLAKLNKLPYYNVEGPKSLGTEWLNANFYPLLPSHLPSEIILSTLTEHVGQQIGQTLTKFGLKSVLLTGGGALNQTLVHHIARHYSGQIIIPEEAIIHYKEALIFAFLGYLYLENLPNCLSSVTGAERDVCGGTLHRPK